MSAAALSTPAPTAYVVTDDAARAHRLRPLLAAAGFAVIGAAGAEALTILLAPDDSSAQIDAIAQAAARRPAVPLIAVMPAAVTRTAMLRAVRAGAHGIVLDDRLDATFVATVRAVAAGQLAVPPSMRRRLAPRALSHREKQTLGLIVRGYTNRQIADTLFVAESTVKTHLSSAFAKLDVRSRAEAAALVLDPDEGYGLGILSIASDGETTAENPASADR